MVKMTVTNERVRALHRNPARTRLRAEGVTRFHAIDSEGAGTGANHRLVLVRCGDRYITNRNGLRWDTIFDFLYSQYIPGSGHAYVGFYLGYDFTQWLKSLPEERAKRLLTPSGKASRLRKFKHGPVGRQFYWPVECGKWEFDMLGTKRLKIRPRGSDLPWMNICDVGGFFQSSFLTAIDPKKWPEPILTAEEFETIKAGKQHRSDAELDDEMVEYNRLECDVLERLMAQLEIGLKTMGIRLKPSQWFGPGQVAQAWLTSQNAISTADLNRLVGDNESPMAHFRLAAQSSYFGGWFEIMAHGIVPGRSYSYDINSAYPFVIARLPCLQHGRYDSGSGRPKDNHNTLFLVHASVFTKRTGNESDTDSLGSHAIGSMLHRDRNGRIGRPFSTTGWYWKHEIDAAIKAGCITDVEWHEWQSYEPCDCPPPLAAIAKLYEERLKINKNSPQGRAYKLGYNSVYGKFAQSVGDPKYGNPIYASLITAGCRTQILNAIATHPGGSKNVLMVATDGVYFLDRHPTLRLSSALGEWEESVHDNLCLYKPGVYWDDSDRRDITEGKAPQFKARGVRASDFAANIAEIDNIFRSWPKANKNGKCTNMVNRSQWKQGGSGWPHIKVKSSFSMVSMVQAVQPGWLWENAGLVKEGVELEQSAWNGAKRDGLWFDPERGIYRSKPLGDEWDWEAPESRAYEKRFGMEDPWSDEYQSQLGITPDGPVMNTLMDMLPR